MKKQQEDKGILTILFIILYSSIASFLMNYYGIAVLNSIFSVFLAETGILFYIFILNDALLDDIKIKRDNELKYMLLMAPFISALLAFGTSSWQNGNTLGILGAFIIVILFVEVLMKKRD